MFFNQAHSFYTGEFYKFSGFCASIGFAFCEHFINKKFVI